MGEPEQTDAQENDTESDTASKGVTDGSAPPTGYYQNPEPNLAPVIDRQTARFRRIMAVAWCLAGLIFAALYLYSRTGQ